jgi:hypothetical protein
MASHNIDLVFELFLRTVAAEVGTVMAIAHTTKCTQYKYSWYLRFLQYFLLHIFNRGMCQNILK